MLPGARIGARTLLSASVRKDADGRADNSSSGKPGSITPEEPALRTGVSALPTSYRVIGQPEDLDGARELALQDRYGFQWWILPLIGARAFGAEKGFYHSPGRNKDYPRY